MDRFDDAPPAARLHRLLLGIAGHAPDRVVAQARLALAEGRAAPAAEMVTAAAQARAAAQPDPPYLFQPIPPGTRHSGAHMPPVLDLTSDSGRRTAPGQDRFDLIATAATPQLVNPVALWRSWRSGSRPGTPAPPTRVFIVEVDAPVTDLPVAAGTVMRCLIDAGLHAPQVEVYPTDMDLPAYQRQARAHSALLWAAGPPTDMRIARVFDTVDAETGPGFSPAHERLDGDEHDLVLAYLSDAEPLASTTSRILDVVEPARGEVVPIGYRTDGQWIWTDTVSYYLRTYGLAPDPRLLEHVRANDFILPALTAAGSHRALAKLLQPGGT